MEKPIRKQLFGLNLTASKFLNVLRARESNLRPNSLQKFYTFLHETTHFFIKFG